MTEYYLDKQVSASEVEDILNVNLGSEYGRYFVTSDIENHEISNEYEFVVLVSPIKGDLKTQIVLFSEEKISSRLLTDFQRLLANMLKCTCAMWDESSENPFKMKGYNGNTEFIFYLDSDFQDINIFNFESKLI